MPPASPPPSKDGRVLLNDGLQPVLALQDANAVFTNGLAPDHEWPQNLLQVFTNGVPVGYADYQEDDRNLVVATNVLAHDTDSNRYRHSTIKDQVGVVLAVQKKIAGGASISMCYIHDRPLADLALLFVI